MIALYKRTRERENKSVKDILIQCVGGIEDSIYMTGLQKEYVTALCSVFLCYYSCVEGVHKKNIQSDRNGGI